MKLYAIQQISTLLLVPAGGKHLRGHTHQEPCADRPPRIFASQSTAKRALKSYAQGRWVDGYSNTMDGPEYDGPEPKKGTARDARDFRLVILDCKLRSIT